MNRSSGDRPTGNRGAGEWFAGSHDEMGSAEPGGESDPAGDGVVWTPEFRHFGLQPIVGANRQPFGMEALFRAGWEDAFSGDPDAASEMMIDNWLLFGFDELAEGRPVFLNCTRETLMSSSLSLLPHSAVLEILETVEPDDELLERCRWLQSLGYRFALDDFSSLEKMEAFLGLADFIKVDFRHSGRRERACMLRRLKLTGATLVAEKIESEEEFRQAKEEGFGLFQGYYFGERVSFMKKRDALDMVNCRRILEELEETGGADGRDELLHWIDREPGIECRLLRVANWASRAVVNSTPDALAVVSKADVRNLVTLAMRVAADERAMARSGGRRTHVLKYGGAPARRAEMGTRAVWWQRRGQGGLS